MFPQNYLPSEKIDTYNTSLITVTRIGALIGSLYESFYFAYYLLAGYPLQTQVFQVIAALISLTALVRVHYFRRYRLAAFMTTFGLYLSVSGTALYTGGINSSSIPWLIFVPVVAAMMTGKRGGALWAGISLVTVLGLFGLNEILGIDLTLYPSSNLDRLIDISLLIVLVLISAWLNESTKQNAMQQLEKARTNLEELALIDPLTGAYNRRHFFVCAQKEYERAIRYHHPVSILLFDIDYFKTINDSYGHAVGDQILSGLVTLVSGLLRKGDILARFGGEEFVIYLPETGVEDAASIAERLRSVLESTPLQTDNGFKTITISIGVAGAVPSSTLTIETLIHQADSAMYMAKRGGRNMVETWQPVHIGASQ